MAEPKRGTHPIVVEEAPGTKWYCQCGLSDNLPYCDGSHARHNTGIKPIAAEITEPCTRAICQCRLSNNKPWCDGSHRTL